MGRGRVLVFCDAGALWLGLCAREFLAQGRCVEQRESQARVFAWRRPLAEPAACARSTFTLDPSEGS